MFLSFIGLPLPALARNLCAAVVLLAALPLGANALPISPAGSDADHPAPAMANDPLKQLRDAIAGQPPVVAPDDPAELDSADIPHLQRFQAEPAAGAVRDQAVARPDGGVTVPIQQDIDPRDETLGQVLRLIVSVDRSDPAAVQRRSGGRGDPDATGLSSIVLDSETSAALLRKVIDIKSTDGNVTVFSVVGLGDFVLEVTPGEHSWTIAELSSGWSLPVSSGSDGVTRSGGAGDAAADPGEDDRSTDAVAQKGIGLIRLIRWLREFVLSPFGLLCILMLTLFALLWGAAKTIVALERRSLGRRGY